MKQVFELTKREQRVVILVMVALVTIAFVKHWLQTKSIPAPQRSTAFPTASPALHHVQDEADSDNSH
jgi:hypothetical protein